MAHTVAPGLQTPADGIDLWIAKLQAERYSPRTIHHYAWAVRRYLQRDPTPTSLSIRSYLASRLSEVSAALVSFERKALKSFFDFLSEEGFWSHNPLNGVRPVPVRRRDRRLPLEGAVYKLLGARCYRAADTTKFRLMVTLLLDTGLRVNEATSILKKDTDLQRLEIMVVGKGDKERVVPISPVTAELVAQYVGTHINGSPYLFPSDTKEGYWHYTGVEKMMARACRRLGIEHITPHQLRHYFATYALKNGAKLEVISRILGHTSVGITADVYRHIQMEEMRDEHQKFSPLRKLPKMLGAP